MPRTRLARWAILIAAAIAATTIAYFLPLLDWIAAAQVRIETYGAWAPVLYVALYVLFTLALIPGSALTFTAGLLYGTARGTAISLSASTLAACLAFLVARYLLRDRFAKKFADSPRFQALDRAVAGDAWKIVILMRLSPAFPYVLLNYAFGLTRVRLPTFAFFSLVGMIPATLILTTAAAALGKAAEEAKREMAEAGPRPPLVLMDKGPSDPESVKAGITWLRNRQLVLWRENEPGEPVEQARLASLVDSLANRLRAGSAEPPPRPGESPESARHRVADALHAAGFQAREAANFFDHGRPGTARDRQKTATEYLATARGDGLRINWALWTALGASLLVTLAVGRMAQKALAEASKNPAGLP
ncbi:MAG: TVP38/TMEM64 family protein [Planctomycetota bacterium]